MYTIFNDFLKYNESYENNELTWLECAEKAGYNIKKEIGSGSMGVLYSLKNEPNIIKITNSKITANTAQYLTKLKHPNLVNIYDVKHLTSNKYVVSDQRTSWYEQPMDLYIIEMEKLDKKGKIDKKSIDEVNLYLENNIYIMKMNI